MPGKSLISRFSVFLAVIILPIQLQPVLNADTPENPTTLSLEEIHKKANAGLPYYQAYMGIIYRTGYKNVRIDYDKSLQWTQLAVEKNHPLGLANLGAIRLWEVEDAKDTAARRRKQSEAKQFYDDAYLHGLSRLAKYGDPLAADLLADYYFVSSPPSPKLCEKFLRIGVEKGYPRCMCALGFFQMTGHGGIAVNKKEGIYHLEQAASQFLPEGLMNLGTAYLKGDGVPESREKAIILYKEAARRGHKPATRALEKIANYKGAPADGNRVKAPPAQSTPPEPTNAPIKPPVVKQTGGTTAKPGRKPAVNSPRLRPTPHPQPKQPEQTEASAWIHRAEAGEALAQRHLGLMYWVGKDGVPKDLNKAKEWLGKAAAQGDELAKKRLQLLIKLYNL